MYSMNDQFEKFSNGSYNASSPILNGDLLKFLMNSDDSKSVMLNHQDVPQETPFSNSLSNSNLHDTLDNYNITTSDLNDDNSLFQKVEPLDEMAPQSADLQGGCLETRSSFESTQRVLKEAGMQFDCLELPMSNAYNMQNYSNFQNHCNEIANSGYQIQSESGQSESFANSIQVKIESQLTPEEQREIEKKENRKARNRKAAEKCRKNKQKKQKEMEADNDYLKEENQILRQQMQMLTMEVNNLKYALQNHNCMLQPKSLGCLDEFHTMKVSASDRGKANYILRIDRDLPRTYKSINLSSTSSKLNAETLIEVKPSEVSNFHSTTYHGTLNFYLQVFFWIFLISTISKRLHLIFLFKNKVIYYILALLFYDLTYLSSHNKNRYLETEILKLFIIWYLVIVSIFKFEKMKKIIFQTENVIIKKFFVCVNNIGISV